jgi:hypothetical protein
MNSKVRQIGNIKLDITDDQKAFVLLMHTTPDVEKIIGKIGIKMLLDRLDNDDMQSIKTLHKFTGWMLEWKEEVLPMSKQLLSGGVFTNEHNRYDEGDI